jgi:hypothetical protein
MQYSRFFLPGLLLLAACPPADDMLEDGTVDGSVDGDGTGDVAGDPNIVAGDSHTVIVSPGADQPDEPAGIARTLALFDAVRLSSDQGDAHFQKAQTELDFGAGPFAKVTLFVDLDTTCFPFSRWSSEDIPEGQNFPPSCDAVDRNFEITFDEPERPGDPPSIDVMRAITPFGGPMHLEVDVTDFANARPGKHRMQAMIGTWPDPRGMTTGARGGWNVSAHVALTTGRAPTNVLAVAPLFNQLLGHGEASTSTRFELPEGTQNIRIELRTTGHGGGMDPTCFGQAEEFCVREHSVKLDGRMVESFDITRTDCDDHCTMTGEPGAQYCLENPTGDPDIVMEPRAGWCPGTLSAPHSWLLPASGLHTFEYDVDHIAPDGNIRASAIVYAIGEG